MAYETQSDATVKEINNISQPHVIYTISPDSTITAILDNSRGHDNYLQLVQYIPDALAMQQAQPRLQPIGSPITQVGQELYAALLPL